MGTLGAISQDILFINGQQVAKAAIASYMHEHDYIMIDSFGKER